MINYSQAIILGLLQGVTELFPVSSLGHTVILPALFGWNIDQSDALFLMFVVATHFATALALLVFFYKDWVRIIRGFFSSLVSRNISGHAKNDGYAYQKLSWLLIFGTVPAGLIGLLFQNKIQALFASPRLVALFLIANGLMLWAVEKLHQKKHATHDKNEISHTANQNHHGHEDESDVRLAGLTRMQSVKVGLAQSLALIPGFSRTGATQGGGIAVGLSRLDAARFAFLLATPIIFAAAALKLPGLRHLVAADGLHILGPIIAGSLAAFLAAYFSTRFLVRYFKTKTLLPFAIYCMAFGVFASLVFLIVR